MEKVLTDCIHFPLDRPCRHQKEEGVRCSDCTRYEPVAASKGGAVGTLLIVKLGAMGDVLRTTFLLPGLREKYPGVKITWITAPVSVKILEGNPFLHEIWPMGGDVYKRLMGARFDAVINLDLAPESLCLATLAVAGRRIGYWLDAKRSVRCSNAAAREWLSLSAYDELKKANTRTYQYWMARITELPRPDYEIYTPLLKDAAARARTFAAASGLDGKRVVGINPGAGGRWKLKKWTDAGYVSLIKKLDRAGYKVLLLGGPDEKDLIARLAARSNGVAVSAGTDNPLPDFFARLNLCELLVSGDTLAMHAALGLGKKVVSIFGPTSAPEIEVYGRGVKVVTPAPCACCYRPSCTVKPDCMKQISVDTVWKAVRELLSR